MNIYLRIGGILVIKDIEGRITDDHPKISGSLETDTHGR